MKNVQRGIPFLTEMVTNILVIIIIIVLRQFVHTIISYSIKICPVHLSLLTHTLSCLLSHTPSMSFYPSPSSYTTYPLQLSALRYPIISLLTFHMPKPSQPATPNNSIHTLNTQLK